MKLKQLYEARYYRGQFFVVYLDTVRSDDNPDIEEIGVYPTLKEACRGAYEWYETNESEAFWDEDDEDQIEPNYDFESDWEDDLVSWNNDDGDTIWEWAPEGTSPTQDKYYFMLIKKGEPPTLEDT